MTSATDELRRLLDERGIEYAESQDRFHTWFRFDYCEACGDHLKGIEVMGACITASKSYLTPEQAIAATLGGANVDDALALLDEMNEQGRIEYADYSQLHDAIAATLGRGTCRNVHEPPKDGTFWPAPHFKCSECGATHVSMEYVFYCPNCGAKVVSADA